MAEKKWIKGAIKRPGALRKKLGVKVGEKISAKELASAKKSAKKKGDTRTLKQIALAKTLKKMKKKG